MKLPSMTSSAVHASANAYAARSGARPATGITPMLSISCLLGCGMSALGCIHCGTDIGCWTSCAGPGAIGCITGCL